MSSNTEEFPVGDFTVILLQALKEHPGSRYCSACLARAAGIASSTGFEMVPQFMQEARAGLGGRFQASKDGRCSVCGRRQPAIGQPETSELGAA